MDTYLLKSANIIDYYDIFIFKMRFSIFTKIQKDYDYMRVGFG